MSSFYSPFSVHQTNNERARRPEVIEILPTLFVGEYPRVEDAAWLQQEFGISAVFSLQDAEDLAVKGLSLPALVTAYQQHQIEFRRPDLALAQSESIVVSPGQTFKRRYTLGDTAE